MHYAGYALRISKKEKTVLPRHTTYKGKSYKLMSFDDAMAEYDKQKAQGKKPAIVSVQDGYIITEAMFTKEK